MKLAADSHSSLHPCSAEAPPRPAEEQGGTSFKLHAPSDQDMESFKAVQVQGGTEGWGRRHLIWGAGVECLALPCAQERQAPRPVAGRAAKRPPPP